MNPIGLHIFWIEIMFKTLTMNDEFHCLLLVVNFREVAFSLTKEVNLMNMVALDSMSCYSIIRISSLSFMLRDVSHTKAYRRCSSLEKI